jgi:hypothetical protein
MLTGRLRGGLAELRLMGGLAELRLMGGLVELRLRGGLAELRLRDGLAELRLRSCAVLWLPTQGPRHAHRPPFGPYLPDWPVTLETRSVRCCAAAWAPGEGAGPWKTR